MKVFQVQNSICQKIDQSLPKLKIKVHHKEDVIIPIVNKIRYFFQLFPWFWGIPREKYLKKDRKDDEIFCNDDWNTGPRVEAVFRATED